MNKLAKKPTVSSLLLRHRVGFLSFLYVKASAEVHSR